MASASTKALQPGSPEEFLARHLISLEWVDRTPGERASANQGYGKNFGASAFVMEVGGHWFAVTAGHVLADLDDARKRGQVLEGFQLNDTWAAGPSGGPPVPTYLEYLLENGRWLHIETAGLDYACIYLSTYYSDLLKANGIVPFRETAWQESVPKGPDFHTMLGVPSELRKINLGSNPPCQEASCVLIPVRPPGKLPEDLARKPHRFYGKLDARLSCPDGTSLTDIDGMSGCPIMAFKSMPNDEMRYWVVALQCAWLPSKRIIIGSKVLVLGNAIRDVIVPQLRQNPDAR